VTVALPSVGRQVDADHDALSTQSGGQAQAQDTAQSPSEGEPDGIDEVDTVLSLAHPNSGPTSGGPEIALFVSILPSIRQLYARFGQNIGAATVRYKLNHQWPSSFAYSSVSP
jgi:hypothetical protein